MDQTVPRILSTSRNRHEKHQGRRLVLAVVIALFLHTGLWTALDHYLGLNRYSISEIPPMSVRIQYISPSVEIAEPAAPVRPAQKRQETAESESEPETPESHMPVITEAPTPEETKGSTASADSADAEEDTPAVEKPPGDTPVNSMRYSLTGTKDFPSRDFSVLSSGMHLPKPDYPPAAKRWGYEGTVRARIIISAEGTVQSVIIEKSSGYPILDDAVSRTIIDLWEFNPPGSEISILKDFEFSLH